MCDALCDKRRETETIREYHDLKNYLVIRFLLLLFVYDKVRIVFVGRDTNLILLF
jgi:hypothetical protein